MSAKMLKTEDNNVLQKPEVYACQMIHLNRFSYTYVWTFKCIKTFLSEHLMLTAEPKINNDP